mgnify:CR=1 FL=1
METSSSFKGFFNVAVTPAKSIGTIFTVFSTPVVALSAVMSNSISASFVNFPDFFNLAPSNVTFKPALPSGVMAPALTVTFLIYSFKEISDAFVASFASGRYTLTKELSTVSAVFPVYVISLLVSATFTIRLLLVIVYFPIV